MVTTNEDSNIIGFAYDTEDIFNLVSTSTLYYAKNKRDNEGNDIIDSIAITEDERDFVVTELSPVLSSLFGRFITLTNSVKDSLFINELKGEKYQSGFSIKKNNSYVRDNLFNENRLTIVDNLCRDYITCSIILNWYKSQSIMDEVANRTLELAQITKTLNNNLFYLKLTPCAKSYNVEVIKN